MLDINNFKENLVEYECVRVRDTQSVWINAAEIDSLADVLGYGSTEVNFARFFSYVSKANRCFREYELDENERRVYFAERYGGRGVGENGGGGRAGNFGKFQVKGSGPNLLARSSATWHSYGSLNLIDAGYEAIYSTVLDGILPLGCAKIYGVIHTSTSGAFQMNGWGSKNAELLPAPGALLVREQAVRPAHFMHAERFSPPKSAALMHEPNRIRAVHRQLKRTFASNNDFIQFLGKFILSAAKQFAFARAARITHGGVSPSNICLDGRWIDLTEARFLSGGKNFCGSTPFYDEPQIIVESFTRLIYVFGKCNVAQFNVEPLIRYFHSVFDNCFAYYSLCILGLPNTNLSTIAESEDGTAYVKAFSGVILKGKQPVLNASDGPDPDDPVIAFMRLSYIALTDMQTCLPKLGAILNRPPSEALAVLAAFRNVVRNALAPEVDQADLEAYRSRVIASAIKALRWAYLSAYFYRGTITPRLYHVVGDRDISALGSFIQECVDHSKWIFDTACSGEVVILETGEVRISFNQARCTYTVTDGGEHTFRRYEDCLMFLTADYPSLRLSGTFDPFFYLQGIGDVLFHLEQMSCIPS